MDIVQVPVTSSITFFFAGKERFKMRTWLLAVLLLSVIAVTYGQGKIMAAVAFARCRNINTQISPDIATCRLKCELKKLKEYALMNASTFMNLSIRRKHVTHY